MKTMLRSIFTTLALIGLAFVVLSYTTNRNDKSAAQTDATSTPFHEGFPSPEATPVDHQGHTMPLPAPEDRETANSMTNAGIAMIQAGQSMDDAAAVMIASANPTLVEVGGHWYQDGRALRNQGAWMIVTATSDSMVHDPSKAHELDLTNLQANGMVMEAEGQAMAEHGRAMIDQVDQLRTDGSLPAAMAADLTARGQDLIATGDQMARDGKRMQEGAERLLRSLGK